MAQPNFQALSDRFRGIADDIGLIANLPAVQDRQELGRRHEQLVDLIQGINLRFDQLELRLELRLAAQDNNSVARSLNASVTRKTTTLHPLKTSVNEDVEGFPEILEVLDTLPNQQLNNLLRAYNLSVAGAIHDRRSRFRKFCGIGWDG